MPPGSNLRSDEMVGATGFEPVTSCPPDRCATGLRHAPTVLRISRGWMVAVVDPRVLSLDWRVGRVLDHPHPCCMLASPVKGERADGSPHHRRSVLPYAPTGAIASAGGACAAPTVLSAPVKVPRPRSGRHFHVVPEWREFCHASVRRVDRTAHDGQTSRRSVRTSHPHPLLYFWSTTTPARLAFFPPSGLTRHPCGNSFRSLR